MAMSADEIKKEFGITPEQLDQWEADAAAGILHENLAGRLHTVPAALLCSMRK